MKESKFLRNLNSQFFCLIFVTSILTFLDLGLFSSSFIFGFVLVIFNFSNGGLKITKIFWPLGLFLCVALLSLLLSGFTLGFAEIKIYFQTVYWFSLALVVSNLYERIDKYILSKYIFYSVIFLLILYVSGLKLGFTQNGVAFTAIVMIPLSFYYLKSSKKRLLYVFAIIYLMLLNGSRSGSVISIFQCSLILIMSINFRKISLKQVTVTYLFLIFLFVNDYSMQIMGEAVSKLNPKLGELLINREYVLSNDLSWLQRQAQVQKGVQIFNSNPLLGIGYTKFADYDIDIDLSVIDAERNIRNIDNRSSHNTYISWLAETGLFGISTMILFFVFCITKFWQKINFLGGKFEFYIFISLLGVLVYFYTISAHLGTSIWLFYGLLAGSFNYLTKK